MSLNSSFFHYLLCFFQDWEESKAAFEEYQHHSTQELDDGLAKLEEEKQTLQVGLMFISWLMPVCSCVMVVLMFLYVKPRLFFLQRLVYCSSIFSFYV